MFVGATHDPPNPNPTDLQQPMQRITYLALVTRPAASRLSPAVSAVRPMAYTTVSNSSVVDYVFLVYGGSVGQSVVGQESRVKKRK